MHFEHHESITFMRTVHKCNICFLHVLLHAQETPWSTLLIQHSNLTAPMNCIFRFQTTNQTALLHQLSQAPKSLQARIAHRRTGMRSAASNPSAAVATEHLPAPQYDSATWPAAASGMLSSLGLPTSTTPQQLWQHLSDLTNELSDPSLENQQQQVQEGQEGQEQPPPPQLQQQQQVQLPLDVTSCRLLMSTAAATCSTQQQYNQLRPLLAAVPAVFPEFVLTDFRQLLQLCAQARYVPDKEWLASIYYADTGGFERFYKQVGIITRICTHSLLFGGGSGLWRGGGGWAEGERRKRRGELEGGEEEPYGQTG